MVAAAFVEKACSPNLLHAAGFLIGNGAALISGASYAGKSKLTFLAWSRGYQILGDNWLFYSQFAPEVTSVPKPLKPRVYPEDFPTMSALCAGRPHYFGTLRGEHRLMVGRSEGFHNHWDRPVRVDHMIFIQKSADEGNHMDRKEAREALPLLLAQTLLSEVTMTLDAVTFSKTLIAAGTPFYKLSIGAEAYAPAFDLMIRALAPRI